MTDSPGPRARRPKSAPSPADLAERDRYAMLAAGSADAVRGSARTWQTALTAFITLVTAGVVIKGRDSTTDLTSGWRILVSVLAGGGLLLAVFGLWQTVAAEAGTHPGTKSLQEIREAHGTLAAYQVYLAIRAARRLRLGIRAAAAAMALLITGVVVTWLAPGAATSAGIYIEVTHNRTTTCGTLLSAPVGELRLFAADGTEPISIPFSGITAIGFTDSCP